MDRTNPYLDQSKQLADRALTLPGPTKHKMPHTIWHQHPWLMRTTWTNLFIQDFYFTVLSSYSRVLIDDTRAEAATCLVDAWSHMSKL